MVHSFDLAIFTTPFGTAYWYGAVYTFGFLGVFVWFWQRRRVIGLSNREAVDFTILIAIGVLVGGRVFDIMVYELDYYRDRPLAVLNWWNGGMASHGVLLGGFLAIWVYGRVRRIPILVLLDEIAVPGAFLLAIGRLGNFIEGGVIGSETSLPWGFVYENVEGARHPVALYESAKNLLLIPILVAAIRVWPPGRGIVTGVFLALYAGLRFAVDLLRDYESAWLGIGTGQVFNLAMAGFGIALLLYFRAKPPRRTQVRQPESRPAGLIRAVLLALLVLYPLGIPTSWTHENIIAKRAETPIADVDRNQ